MSESKTSLMNSNTPYEQALALLNEALSFGIDPSLEPITCILHELGDPHRCYPSIQVAGTNGKSSTVRFIAALLGELGLKVGLYTSPELVFYEERIEIGNKVVSRADFASAVLIAHETAKRLIEEGSIAQVTEFELLTAAAFCLFAREQVDYAVLECGLGGRWDATSVVDPSVAVITGIGLDHTAILGDTFAQIAAEKAAIIKPGSKVVLGPGIPEEALKVIHSRCSLVGTDSLVELGISSSVVGEHEPSLDPILLPPPFPSYQQVNICTAIAATEAALAHTLDSGTIRHALEHLIIPGRFETLRAEPLLLIDAAHNPKSARTLDAALQASGLVTADTLLLLGILSDKDAGGIIDALAPRFDRIAVTQSASPRAIPADELAALVAQRSGRMPRVFSSVAKALEDLSTERIPSIVTGSITIVGEAKAWAMATSA
ncbi:MAG: bifunctional folylpolyglutamate synthase/dihydrofolate synthase [Coriobacteriales bacterium]|jgi:dihydrofolate synthase/folylpolyglutamate synthase|nr:bifunctional folylpolyglutamate synthase/dihydrofolate synthase [Coriobacteriales bacterium]